jgi:predicted nucleic acid-binding protein
MGAKKEIVRLVVDSNIIFSSLIKGSKSAALQVIYSPWNVEFYSPEETLEEFNKYSSILENKAREDFRELMFLIFSEIKIIPAKYYASRINDAYEAVKEIDEKDAPFLALSMALNCPLWSDDKSLKSQNKVRVISTFELLKKFPKF